MRVFTTTLVASVLTLMAVGAGATSTIPVTLNASAIPRMCLSQSTTNYWDFQAYDCDCAPPTGSIDTKTYGRWNASQADLGWDYLEISWGETHCQYLGGVLEGLLTFERIAYFVGANQAAVKPETMAWIEKHVAWMNSTEKCPESGTGNSKFWNRVCNVLWQVGGIAEGFNLANFRNGSYSANVTKMDIFLLSFVDEVGDVDIAVDVQAGRLDKSKLLKPRQIGSHCSALIKPTKDDLFVAHDTWDVFSGMSHRIYKQYTDSSRTITMSSYPGQVVSNDDWYQIKAERSSTYLAVQETTNEVFNTSLYTNVVPESVSEFIRVMVANWESSSGEEWTANFARHNSGTYNNQYMVVDFDRYVPGSDIVPGTLWVAEQIPGLVQRDDVSSVLAKKGYWASYNVPYFWNIFDISGYKAMVAKVGSFWSYADYARPEIFRRNETDVHDLATMMRMMRYNNYEEDPFSIIPNCTGADAACKTKHSSMLTIASRGDLMPVYNTTAEMERHYGPLASFVAQGCFGALDSKIANWKNRRSMVNHVISGPTNDQQPTFSYGTAVCPTAPAGSPTTFNFPWLEVINSQDNN